MEARSEQLRLALFATPGVLCRIYRRLWQAVRATVSARRIGTELAPPSSSCLTY